jgi:predicted nucleotidyltransferase
MLPGATCGICRQHAGDVWRILAPCAGPPPGLEQLQLDNHVRFTVRQMKRELANELGKAFPELLQAQDDGDLGKVAVSKVMSARAGAERNSLLDVVVLTLAEDNRCSSRVDFDDALEDMLGEKLDAVWRSRFHNSVYHALRVHDIPCFNRKKSRHGAKKPRLDATGPMIPDTLAWLGGAEKV